MRRWASVAGRHGLLLLEAHSLTVSDTAEFMTEATSLHFDALQSWSGQMLVPAPHWQLALGHAGLLPDENWLCYPKGSPYTRITLQRLVPAPCAGFRLATLSDLPQLLELEEQWDAPFLRSSEATLRAAARASSERPIRCLRWQWHAACCHVHAARGFAGGGAAWSKHVCAHSAEATRPLTTIETSTTCSRPPSGPKERESLSSNTIERLSPAPKIAVFH